MCSEGEALSEPTLEARLLAAHGADDRWALVDLYDEASRLTDDVESLEKYSFYLTHSWVFALETDHPKAAELKARLVRHGRV